MPDRMATRLRALRSLRAQFSVATAIAFSACGDNASEAASTLFGVEQSGLTSTEVAELERIFSEWFPPGADGLGYLAPSCGDVEPTAEVTDLNRDGTSEVFVQWGNACTSGVTGRSLSLFLKDASGAYHDQFGFPALGYRFIEPGSGGYADVVLGGPGFCLPVWAWQGTAYEFKCNQPEVVGGCAFEANVCADR
jgi:hypothetical protein